MLTTALKEEISLVKATKKWWPIFVLPTLLAFIIGFVVPFVEGLYLSFCKFTTINKATWGASVIMSRSFRIRSFGIL